MTMGDAIWRIFLSVVLFALWVLLMCLWVAAVGWVLGIFGFQPYMLGYYEPGYWGLLILVYAVVSLVFIEALVQEIRN